MIPYRENDWHRTARKTNTILFRCIICNRFFVGHSRHSDGNKCEDCGGNLLALCLVKPIWEHERFGV